ncbi:MAG: hypothetical protein E7664_04860 [Ruminococcaceae bacterium]|nr:hypothetical protein [Oscillospiraceae bacterium]
MTLFLIALSTVFVMLLYALPGFLMVKTKLVKESSIPDFARFLMYVCSPMLIIDSFMKASRGGGIAGSLVFIFFFVVLVEGGMLIAFFFLFRKKREDVRYRVYVLATCFSNCGFMGVPILEALLPEYPSAAALSAMFTVAMNVLGWTAGSAIIANDKRYMSLRKLLLNPIVLALPVAILFLATGYRPPELLADAISILARMSTVLCMLIMGMRLATVSIRSLLLRPAQYAVIAIKQLILPLAVLGILWLLPIDPNVRTCAFIMTACPVASVVLSFAEMIGEGQETAANLMLLGTFLSVLTIPVMALLI